MKHVRRASNKTDAVEFGIALPCRGPLAKPAILARLTRAAEALRFTCVTISDHVVLPTRRSGPYPYSATGEFPGGAHQDYQEPLALAGWLLGATKRIRVGISVLVVPYRNPVVTAKQLATLDVLSGGRVIVGCGVGWWAEEFEALAAPPFADRGAVTDEYLRLMTALWTEEEPRFEGKYYRIANVTCLPKPVQKPHPAIWVGGHSARAIRRAAELGAAWHPIGLRGSVGLAPAEMAAKVQALREQVARAGREPGSVRVAFRAPLEIWSARGRAHSTAETPPLCGPAAKVIEDIRAYQRAGVGSFVFDLTSPDPRTMSETMTRFAREIRPRIAARRAER